MADREDEQHDGTGEEPDSVPEAMSFEEFRKAFYYGEFADMQFKFLAGMSDREAAQVIATLLHRLGEAFDTGDLTPVLQAAYEAQVRGYTPDEPPEPAVEEVPFTLVRGSLADARVALISAGGVFPDDDDPMGPDGPSQQESLPLILDFLRSAPTLSSLPWDIPEERIAVRHPGYDATTAQRDPATVFPLRHLRDLADEGRLRLADEHYGFAGACSQSRLRKEVAPAWAEHMAAREVDVALLVAT